MSTLIVLSASLLVAFFISRGIAHHRPEELRPLSWATGGAIAAPIVIGVIATAVKDVSDGMLRFVAFAVAVVLLGYMFLAGAWLLRFLADQMALRR